MNQTPLYSIHQSLGAKLVPFAGFEMPVSYTGIKNEHQTVRNAVGVFDVSHMGEFLIEGPEALQLVQWVTTNDVAALSPGKIQYSCMPNGKGGIVDDLLVYCIHEEQYLLVVNASNINKDWNWIASQNKWDASMRNISEQTALLAVQGPKAAEALQSLTAVNLADIPYYNFKVDTFAGIQGVIISATGYTGAGGFELYVDATQAETLWKAVILAGAPFGIAPCGLGCRDTLRLEMGFCLYGNDINDTTSPIEAGLGWITKFNKSFVDKAILENQKSNGTTRKLVAFEMTERGIPRQHYALFDADNNPIGEVTSGSESPSTEKFIGLGYVAFQHAKIGTPIFVDIRGKKIAAKVVKLPFYQKA